jgi:hypothetical protein
MVINFNKIFEKKIFLLSLILILGIFLRLYNLNFEDLWYDEQASFWVSDPNLSYNQTINRSNELDSGTGLLFNLILKNFFNIFNYNPDVGRILTSIFGILSLPALGYLSFQVKRNNSFLFVVFLASINWYLISYSQEMRGFILLFLFSVLSIIFYFKILEFNLSIPKRIFYSLILIIISVFAAAVNIFFFIITFTQILFLIINFSKYKETFTINFISIFLVPLIYLIIMFDSLILQLGIKDFWIKQVEIDFFYNFFFSRFFGSKIMGLIYLLILIFTIYFNRKRVFKLSSKYFFLFLIIIFSYLLPLSYSLIKPPILIDRYIIFVLIPILILISLLILEIDNKKLKGVLLFILISSSIANNYIEIFDRKISKPEFKKILKYIIKTDKNNVLVVANDDLTQKIVLNYSKNIADIQNKIIFLNEKNKDNFNNVWIVCYKPVNNFNCDEKPSNFFSWNDIDTVNYNLISGILYKQK